MFNVYHSLLMLLIARSAIYVHRRSLLLVSSSSSFSFYYDGISEVMGLIIIGEAVACTPRVIFSEDFKVPKKPWKKSAFSPLLGSQATARLTPILDTLLDTFLSFFEKKCLHHTFTKRSIFAGFGPFGNQCLHHTFTKRFIFAGFGHFARPANITLRASCPAGVV